MQPLMTDIQGVNSLHLHSERAKRDVWLEDLAPLEARDEQSRMEGIAFVNVRPLPTRLPVLLWFGSGH